MKLSKYAQRLGVSYRTVWRLWEDGKLDAYQLPTGTIIVKEEAENQLPDKVCIYARVSSSENKDNLTKQAERLKQYAVARGYQIYKIVEEIGSGVNDNRKRLIKLLVDKSYCLLIVEHKDKTEKIIKELKNETKS